MWLLPVVLQVSGVPVPPLALRWDVAASVTACPPERWFRAEAAAEFGRDPFVRRGAPGAVATVRVVARPVGEAIRVEVFYQRAGEAEQSLARSEGAPGRCRAVLAGAFGALYDVVLPRALPAAPSADRRAPRHEPAADPPAAAAPVFDHERPPTPDGRAAPDPAVTAPAAESPRWRGRVAVLAGLSFGGVIAAPSPLVTASLLVSRGAFGVSVGAAVEPLAGGDATCDGRGLTEAVAQRRVQGDLGACFVGRHVTLCAVALARWVQVRAAALEGARALDGVQLGGALRAEGTWPLSDAVTLIGRLEGSLASPWEVTARVPQAGGGSTRAVCEAWSFGALSGSATVGVAFGLW